MKILITLFLFITTNAFALNCRTNQYAGNIRIDNELGHVAYLYTTGRFVCPDLLDHIVEKKKDFKCAGLWDFRNETLNVDFKFDGEKYVATLPASSVHSKKKLKMFCDI